MVILGPVLAISLAGRKGTGRLQKRGIGPGAHHHHQIYPLRQPPLFLPHPVSLLLASFQPSPNPFSHHFTVASAWPSICWSTQEGSSNMQTHAKTFCWRQDPIGFITSSPQNVLKQDQIICIKGTSSMLQFGLFSKLFAINMLIVCWIMRIQCLFICGQHFTCWDICL